MFLFFSSFVIVYHLFYILFISGRYFEYMEFPKQRWTKIQENNNYEPHFVSVSASPLLPFSPSLPLLLPIYTYFTLNSAIFVFLGSFVNVAYLSWRNKVKKRPEERAKLLSKYKGVDDDNKEGESDAWVELGDRHPDFVYTL